MTLYVGVDPGKGGAIAVLDDSGRAVNLGPMPIVVGGKGARDEYDLPRIRNILQGLQQKGRVFVTVEKLQPLPSVRADGKSMGGTIANFNRGETRGWLWLLTALNVPYTLVAPQTWQRTMLQGLPGDDTGQKSILAAKQLWPTVSLLRTERSRKDDDGLSDALLLAEWGRRQMRGGEVFAGRAGA